MFIFLDDYRVPSDVTWVRLPFCADWTIVRSFDEFKALVDDLETAPTFIAFDHDLADEHYQVMEAENNSTDGSSFDYGAEKTGYECAKYFADIAMTRGWQIPEFVVHSLNPVGRQRIQAYLVSARDHLNVTI